MEYLLDQLLTLRFERNSYNFSSLIELLPNSQNSLRVGIENVFQKLAVLGSSSVIQVCAANSKNAHTQSFKYRFFASSLYMQHGSPKRGEYSTDFPFLPLFFLQRECFLALHCFNLLILSNISFLNFSSRLQSNELNLSVNSESPQLFKRTFPQNFLFFLKMPLLMYT